MFEKTFILTIACIGIFLNSALNAAEIPDFVEPAAAIVAGEEAIRAEEFIKAANILEQALLANPQNRAVNRQLGIAYYKTGRNEQALKQLHRSLELAPEDAESHYALGVVYLARASEVSLVKVSRTLKQSIEHLETTIRLRPDHTAAHYYLIQVLINAPRIVGGDMERAGVLNARLAQLSPLHHQVVNSTLASKRDNHTLAEELLLQSYEGNEGNPLVNFALLSHYHDREQHADAIPYGERFLALPKRWDDVDLAEAHYLLAQCYRATGEQGLSLRHYGLTLASTENRKLREKVRKEMGDVGER